MPLPAIAADPGAFAACRLVIPHYANALNNKVAIGNHALKTAAATGGLRSGFKAGFWRSNASISSVGLTCANLFVAGSRATLYALA
jgi:hypothetical protein